jgi:hypothetical protein
MLAVMWYRMACRGVGVLVIVAVGGVGVPPELARAQAAPGDAAAAPGPTLPAPPSASAAAAPAVVPAPAAPTTGTVHMRNGGFVRGELIELQPGTLVRLKLADGTVREIAWAEVDHVEDPSLPPPAPAATSAQGTGTSVASGPLPSLAVTNADEIRRLRFERDEISNTGPAVMMILGGGAFLLVGLPGLLVLSIGESCESGYDGDAYYERDCSDVRGTGAAMALIGLAGGGVAVWGLIKSGQNRRRWRELNDRVRELKGEQLSLTLDVLPRPNGAGLGLTLRM